MARLFSRLLLATEHSEFDTGAEGLAFALATHCNLPLAVLLPLVSNPEYEALAPQIAAQAEREAALKLGQLRDMADFAGVEVDLHVRRGEEPYREIVDEASGRASDLIVIRRRGKRGVLANLLVGEMVTKVVAHAPCSVLIVPTGARMWSRRVLVAAQPTAQGRRLVAAAASLATECAIPLTIACVASGNSPEQRVPVDTFVAESLELAQQAGLSAQGRTLVGKAFTEILATAASTGADLIVIGNRSDNRIGRALVGGVAQKVIGLAKTPVLVMQCNESTPDGTP